MAFGLQVNQYNEKSHTNSPNSYTAPSTTRGSPTPLSSDSKGERIAYASNKSIFVRSIDNPEVSKQYTAHTAQTTVARFSPSGFYVASGDVSGTVRVWDCVGEGATKGMDAISRALPISTGPLTARR